ncbi:NACHT domain-containing protein [Nocardia farcinica]|uniref:NACHT domain-containing protein n=1 Tax=Nocardia farcinica TaxID=37329 RepID=UPI002455E805|nr:hypothetical protein [Nocardia farcinica]
MTGMETAAGRAAGGLLGPVARTAFRWWWPKSDWASLAAFADRLAAAVKTAEEQVQRELRGAPGQYMHVRFTAAADPLSGASDGSTEVNRIAEYFAGLESPRRMVVLGDAGAGKTVAATYLVLGLIARRNQLHSDPERAAEPVPVRVNAAGWDGGQGFSAWLVARLGRDYRLRPNVAGKMVKAGMILPVLDGLDEMDDDTTGGARARALLDRLNQREWAHRPVVVLCRSNEFDRLKHAGGDNGLRGAATLSLDPLSAGQPAEYLARHQQRIGATAPAWEQLINHIREHAEFEHTDSPLAAALRNPWLLGLAVTTLDHSPATAAALLDSATVEEVRDRLFAAQIPAAIAATDDTEHFRNYTTDTVTKWLHTLARHLEHRRDIGTNGTAIRLDEIWETAGPNRVRLLHGLAAALLSGLVFGLAFWLRDGVIAGVQVGLIGGLMFALAFYLVFSIAPGHLSVSRAKLIAWKVPTGARWPTGLKTGLSVGLYIALLSGLFAGLRDGPVVGLRVGLGAGIVFGPLYGVVVGLQATSADQLALVSDARRLIRNDLQSALVRSALFGLGFVCAVSLVLGLPAGLLAGLLAALMCGLATGLASGRFYLAVLLFKLTANFPTRPAVFLEWARNSGLLRVNATAYQFRHQTYQQWLLDQAVATPQDGRRR